MIYGNVDGVRKALLLEMEGLYEVEIARDEFASGELLELLARYTGIIGREISVYISRSGSVMEVTIGQTGSVSLSAVNKRRGQHRLCGVRCLHTHPGGDARLSDVDRNALKSLRLDAMAALGVGDDGSCRGISAAFLGPLQNGERTLVESGPVSVRRIPQADWISQIMISDADVTEKQSRDVEDEKERVMLVGLDRGEGADSLEELARLCETAGALVVGSYAQKRQKIEGATYIGTGKAQELALQAQALGADSVVFDDELSGSQVRNLEEIFSMKVLDRTSLILDIFAQRAQTREGKLQVELAQMRYQLPRIGGLGVVLSRLAGGIGTRGPGESKLEMDKRHIRKRIHDLTQELEEVKSQRALRRESRNKYDVPVVALVGYTNAGKSSLLNRMSDSDIYVKDQLFATLDTTTRRVELPEGGQFLLVDTVGFINKLPHDIIQAFHATLEEALHADLLLIVSDMASPYQEHQRKVVDEVLGKLGASDLPMLEVLNKADLLPEQQHAQGGKAIPVSATTGLGLSVLLERIGEALSSKQMRFEAIIPYDQGNLLSLIHQSGTILEEAFEETGTKVQALLPPALFERITRALA